MASAELANASATVMACARTRQCARTSPRNARKSPVTLTISLRSPVDGRPTAPTRRGAEGEWTQVNEVFAAAGIGEGEAWWSVYCEGRGDSDGSVIGPLTA